MVALVPPLLAPRRHAGQPRHRAEDREWGDGERAESGNEVQTGAYPDLDPGPENPPRLGPSLLRDEAREARETISPSSSISVTGATPNGILVNRDFLRSDTEKRRRPYKIFDCDDDYFVELEAVHSRGPSGGLARLDADLAASGGRRGGGEDVLEFASTDTMTGSDRGDAEEAEG
jgi:hypothetical protein